MALYQQQQQQQQQQHHQQRKIRLLWSRTPGGERKKTQVEAKILRRVARFGWWVG